ncbi:MAG: ABC transporter substrate-binding protein [Arachnia sp.]
MFPITKHTSGAAVAIAAALVLTSCSGGGGEAEAGDQSMDLASCGPSGDLSILTWRTDLVEDGTFDGYVAAFKDKYPDIGEVDIQGITDYEGEVKTRMSTDDYGDVLAIPGSVTPDQLSQFFEPLGTQEDFAQAYRWINDKSYDSLNYGIPVVGNVMGLVYNKEVFAAAGIEEFPATPDEFLAAMAAVEATDATIAPVYTNYKDGWPLTQWSSFVGTIGGPSATNDMTRDDAPWQGEKDYGVIDALIYDLTEQGLIEDDPTTTNWEQSKQMLATGQIGVMALGSWAIPQMQDAAEAAGVERESIGYMPFPYQADGAFHASAGGDYNLGINVNSANKCAAWAWIDWFNTESGYAESQVGLSPLADGAIPDALADFMAQVELVELDAAPAGKEALFADIDTESGIVTTSPDYRMAMIDDARSGARTKQEIFDQLNSDWATARAGVEG